MNISTSSHVNLKFNLLFHKDLSDTLFHRLLVMQKLIDNKRLKKSTEHISSKYFRFKEVGKVIEQLIDDYYKHKFTKSPHSKINLDDTHKIINETVNDLK